MAGSAPLTSSQLTTAEWVFSFGLVTSLFFTWGFAYGLLDVLNAHFQHIFGITRTQSTLLQLAYFGAYIVFSPFAGMFMRRWGYKAGIHLGLTLYSLGAVFYWPSAKFEAGAQVGVASLAVNFMVEQGVGINASRASQLFSFCQMTFTAGRFTGVLILKFVDPALLLSVYGFACCAFTLGVALATGHAGIGCLFGLFFFESICYPCIFTLGTKNLGVHTKQGSGLIGVGGGAWYPPAQASVADRISTRTSYLVPLSGYIAMTIYAVGMVIDQARKGDFHWDNIDEDKQREPSSPVDSERNSKDKEEASVKIENLDNYGKTA
ncbi:hypothetical protein NLJ89_g4230 [Agrocybe chaxingu]|uniref:Uncharacterized protein n=1 Tax=Agrocybe chaxingu TaxID=84603 RepID=A0A9W8MXV9_9AGAR|nr:hypothetical protein NLJ89_g4230 [Agrocybe chaxingu]